MLGIEYELIRSRRRTLAVTVTGGRVIVRAPQGMPAERILSFLESKQDWIRKTVAKQSDPKFAAWRNGSAILVDGKEIPVFYGAKKDEERGGAFYCRDGRSVRKLLQSSRQFLLEEEMFSLVRQTGLEPSDVQVRDFRARWGSCGSDGVIKLNWRLLMLPADLRQYVLIHELCHLKEMNHSRAFWNLVQGFCPAYKQCLRRLKEYAFLTNLYH